MAVSGRPKWRQCLDSLRDLTIQYLSNSCAIPAVLSRKRAKAALQAMRRTRKYFGSLQKSAEIAQLRQEWLLPPKRPASATLQATRTAPPQTRRRKAPEDKPKRHAWRSSAAGQPSLIPQALNAALAASWAAFCHILGSTACHDCEAASFALSTGSYCMSGRVGPESLCRRLLAGS